MEVYPFHHQNLLFNIITDYDLTFKEIRAMLDHLIGAGAFKDQEEGLGVFYNFELEKVRYEVDVNGYEIVVYRREETGQA